MLRTFLATAVMGLALTGCPAGDDPSPPVPPTGRRWVGVGDAVLAVPDDWRAETQPCAEPDGPVVLLLGPPSGILDCKQFPTDGVSSVRLANFDQHAIELPRRLRPLDAETGLKLLSGGISCVETPLVSCTTTLVLSAVEVAAQIECVGFDAEACVDNIVASVTKLPDGFTTVPVLQDLSAKQADQTLAAAGLKTSVPDTDFPWYVVGTDPAVGTPVPLGSTVHLLPGDG